MKTIATIFACVILSAFAPCIEQEANANNQHSYIMPIAASNLPPTESKLKLTPKQARNFLSKVSISDECWLWCGGRMKNGYANFFVGEKSFRVHRLSYLLFVGEIPDKMGVCHRCDVRHCINPKHLFTGTQKDNLQDCKAKGRTTVGRKNFMAKISDEDAIEIRRLYSLGSITQREIASKFKIAGSNVSRIVSGLAWSHV